MNRQQLRQDWLSGYFSGVPFDLTTASAAALSAALSAATSKQELEDIYLPYRPRRRTRAQAARERGLEPLADALFGRIQDGWQATHDGLLTVTRQTRLLERHPALETSIRLRLPYIEPLNLLQIELLKRYRSGEEDARIGEGILLSINAIATALRNSG